MIDPVLDEKMSSIAEGIFGTEHDPDQIPITQESKDKLERMTPHWFQYRLDEAGEPIAWVVVVPTTRELARSFLDGEITEREMFDRTPIQERYGAAYLCAAITVPPHRRTGLATALFREAVGSMDLEPEPLIFAWPYSEEGKLLAKGQAFEDWGVVLRS